MPTGRIRKKVKVTEETLLKKMEDIEQEISNFGLHEYLTYLSSPKRIIWTNLVAGTMRGFGFVLGATVVVAIVTIAVSYLVSLPIVGEWFGWLGDILRNRPV